MEDLCVQSVEFLEEEVDVLVLDECAPCDGLRDKVWDDVVQRFGGAVLASHRVVAGLAGDEFEEIALVESVTR